MIQHHARKALYELAQDDDSAVELYSALCNVVWVPENYPQEDARAYDESRWKGEHDEVIDFSWRGAAQFVADLREQDETYLDFYCSGEEGDISGRVLKVMKSLGLRPLT